MNPDAIIGDIIGKISRRYLSFGEAPLDVSLPTPAPDRRYLLYLHIPFCVVLCPFCSFHRVEFKRGRTRQYFRQLRREIRLATDAGFSFNELYVGGGTPTVIPGELDATIALARSLHSLSDVSAETNPDDLDDEKLPMILDCGINRLSVGVQSFDDTLLREMQRYDKYGSGDQILTRLRNAQGQFDTLNIDMIFNFPHQTEQSLQADLDLLTGELQAEQVSWYPLMTAKSARKSMAKEMGTVNYGREKAFYQQIVRHMLDLGYTRSSAWCFSQKPGLVDEYITEHNEYLGLGSGAFSYINGSIFSSTFSINHYLQLVGDDKTGIVRQRQIGATDQMRYYLMMRLFSGSLDLAAAEEQFAGRFQRGLRLELGGLRLLGAIERDEKQIRLTERGYYIWVMMMREFFTGVNQLREEMRHNISKEATLR